MALLQKFKLRLRGSTGERRCSKAAAARVSLGTLGGDIAVLQSRNWFKNKIGVIERRQDATERVEEMGAEVTKVTNTILLFLVSGPQLYVLGNNSQQGSGDPNCAGIQPRSAFCVASASNALMSYLSNSAFFMRDN